MSERIGTCLQCGQRFGGIPESVTANKVKCQSCGGVVEIPPIAAAASAAKQPLATPLAEPKAKERPAGAKNVDRTAAAKAPAKEAVVPPKPVAKKPFVPPKPIARKAVVPPKPVGKKPAPPKPTAPKPVAKKAAPPKPAVKKPAPPVAARRAEPEKKPSAADILAKAKAKRQAQASGAGASAAKKPSAAEILAKAKAKRAAASQESSSALAKPNRSQPRQPSGGAPRRAAGGPSRRPSRRTRDEDEYEEPARSNTVAILSLVGLVVIGGGAIWWFMRPTEEVVTDDNATVEAPAGGAGAEEGSPAVGGWNPTAGGTNPNEGSDATASGDPAEAGDPAEGNAAESSAEGESKPEEVAKPAGPAGEWVTPAAGGQIQWQGFTEPGQMRLSEVPALTRHASTTDDTWAELNEDLALVLDDAGVRSTRAGDRMLEDYPRDSFPAIVNAAMQIDWNDHEQVRIGGALVNTLDRMWVKGGSRFGWYEPARHEVGSADWNASMVKNKEVVCRWYNYWLQSLGHSDTAWETFSGTGAKASDEGGVAAPDDPFGE